jgi:DNA-directed RNA polymerase specialized sigma24 family protein
MKTERHESPEDMRSIDPLARRLANGDPGAPKGMVERHHAELCRYARSLLRDGSAAEDAVQTAFERALSLPRRGRSPPPSRR